MRETNNAYDRLKQQSKIFARNLIQTIILQNRREKQTNVDTHNPRLLRFSEDRRRYFKYFNVGRLERRYII